MTDENNVWFSLFKGNIPSPVKVFEKGDWVLDSGVALTACIIGKSHRICFRFRSDYLTEFIAYSMENFSCEPVDQKPLNLGDLIIREFKNGLLFYKVKIEVIDQVYLNFGQFLKTVSDIESYETMFREFKNPLLSSNNQPFTGIVIEQDKNRIFTVHTYPERNFSVISVVKVNVSVN